MTKDPYPGATRCLYISCPICGMSKPLMKKGSAATQKGKVLKKGVKGLQHFNQINVKTHKVVQERACLGPPLGFKPTRALTLEEIKNDPAFEWVKAELAEQCREILAELGLKE